MSYNILQHLEYNAWANARIANAARQVEEKVLFDERKSSFSSIAKTLTHVLDSEHVWLKRLQGVNLKQFPSAGLTIAKDELIDGFEKRSEELLAFVQSKGDEFISTSIDYITLKGQPFRDTVEDMLYHVVNHGTYHRGQIITMMREAGIETLPATDLIIFLRTKSTSPL
jgi:uncharacterized damage-inducible protein DinB